MENIPFGSQLRREIQQALISSGYRKLGRGVDAEVWMRDAGKVAKIIISDYSQAPAIKIADTLYRFSQKHKLPNLPRYIEIDGRRFFKFKIGGMPFAQYNMEQLDENTQPVDTQIIYEFSQCVQEEVPWTGVSRVIAEREDLSNSMKKKLLQRIQAPEYQLLYETMQALFKFGKSRGFYWDLHTENVMRRPGTGELVIIDPWSG